MMLKERHFEKIILMAKQYFLDKFNFRKTNLRNSFIRQIVPQPDKPNICNRESVSVEALTMTNVRNALAK